MRLPIALALAALAALAPTVRAQTPGQPKVQPGPNEPDWAVVLETLYGLQMFDDLLNPVKDSAVSTPGLFKKAGPGKVTFTPVIALGLETPIRGGWYAPGEDDTHPQKHELFTYQFKNTGKDLETGSNLPPRLDEGSTTAFDPGDKPFGFWVVTEQFGDGVFTQPRLVAANNPRLAKQPYKAMIYPLKDRETNRIIPHSYIVGFEYSTNDDFQDVVCRVDNADLLPAGGEAK